MLLYCNQTVFATPDWKNINEIELDRLIQEKIDDARIPGLSVGIIKDNQVVYLKGFGKADSSGRVVTSQTPFVIGSVSKTFTAMAIMQLVEEGKIELDMPVCKYITWFGLADTSSSSKITVRELLNHTSGISVAHETIHAETIEQFVRGLRNTKLTKPVGSMFQYSNTNYVILGQLIQSVAKLPYEVYIKKNIFAPLDMKHSYVSEDDAQKNGLATGYMQIFGFPTPVSPVGHAYELPFGSIITCAEDMTHYASALLNGGKYKNASVISQESFRRMYTPSSIVSPTQCYGLGWHMDIGCNMFYHGGSTENFQSNITVIPKNSYALVVLYNTSFEPVTTLLKGNIEAISYYITSISVGVPPPAKLSIKKAYIIIDFILLCLASVLIFYLFRLRHWIFTLNKNRVLLRSVLALFINFFLPVTVIVSIPKYYNVTWYVATSNMPEIAYFIIGYCIILLIVGILKCFWIMKYFYNSFIQSKKK